MSGRHVKWANSGRSASVAGADGVDQDSIVNGIRAGKLEYREGDIWGNPYLRVLRSQLEDYITQELGTDYLRGCTNQTELQKIKKEMADLQRRLVALQARKTEIENDLEAYAEPSARLKK